MFMGMGSARFCVRMNVVRMGFAVGVLTVVEQTRARHLGGG